jgi:uncharacterized damage-inducible protein DinB
MPAPDSIPEIKNKLIAEREKLIAAFANLPREVVLKPFGDDGWSIKDLVAHVAASEAINVKLAMLMVAKNEPVQLAELASDFPDFPPPFDLDKFNAYTMNKWRAKSLEEIIVALEQTRAETLAWLDTLTPAQLERTGEHAVWGKQSVRAMMRILVIHDKAHRGDIEKRKG